MYFNRDRGDESYFILICKNFSEYRSKYIPRYYDRNPNIITFEHLMSVTAPQKLKKLYMDIDIIMESVNTN